MAGEQVRLVLIKVRWHRWKAANPATLLEERKKASHLQATDLVFLGRGGRKEVLEATDLRVMSPTS